MQVASASWMLIAFKWNFHEAYLIMWPVQCKAVVRWWHQIFTPGFWSYPLGARALASTIFSSEAVSANHETSSDFTISLLTVNQVMWPIYHDWLLNWGHPRYHRSVSIDRTVMQLGFTSGQNPQRTQYSSLLNRISSDMASQGNIWGFWKTCKYLKCLGCHGFHVFVKTGLV